MTKYCIPYSYTSLQILYNIKSHKRNKMFIITFI